VRGVICRVDALLESPGCEAATGRPRTRARIARVRAALEDALGASTANGLRVKLRAAAGAVVKARRSIKGGSRRCRREIRQALGSVHQTIRDLPQASS
jgi:hypothetical protein